MLSSQLRDIHAVVFDAGGTLVQVDARVFQEAATARGREISESGLRRAEAQARIAIDRRADASGAATGDDQARLRRYFRDVLAQLDIRGADAEQIAESVEASHRRENLWRTPVAGAAELLSGLRLRGFRSAVVSNADGRAESGLERAGLRVHVEFVVDSHAEGVEKPDPEIFWRALRRLGVDAQRAVYIGDIYSIDVVGARAAGMQAVILDPTASYAGLDCPVIADLTQLLAALPQDGPRRETA